MEKSHELVPRECLNCNASIHGGFCHQCGQAVRDNTNRSIGQLLGEFFGNIFFLDNRFFLSVRYLFLYPCRMTVEFLEGKRKNCHLVLVFQPDLFLPQPLIRLLPFT